MRHKREVNIALRWVVIALVLEVIAGGLWAGYLFYAEAESGLANGLVWAIGGVGAVMLAAAGWGAVRLLNVEPSMTRMVARVLMAALAYGGLEGLLYATTGWLISASVVGQILAGVLGAAVLFVALLALARRVLMLGGGPFSVARTVLDEAVHMKIAIVFIVLLLVIVPALPFMSSFSDVLRYRVQSFLSYSMTATMVLLSLLTIFLACWTLSGEIEQKQIFSIATKPISRFKYLFGKWLGIVVLNGILLTVSSLAIWGYTMHLSRGEASEEHDRLALEQEVLTARVSRQAKPTRPIEDMANERLQELYETEREAIRIAGEARARELGLTNVGAEMEMDLGADAMFEQMMLQIERQWRSIAPMRSTTFVFDGLEDVQRTGGEHDSVQLRYLARVTSQVPNAELDVVVDINGQQSALKLVTGRAQVLPIPADMIEDGELRLTIYNQNPQAPRQPRDVTIVFDGGEGLEVLYRAGSFTPNFVRGMLVNWLKLSFLAMLGLTAATFLGFPVASLLGLLVFVVATASPFLLEASSEYYNTGYGLIGLLRNGISSFSAFVAMLLQSYATYSPGSLVVDGRYFGWDQVAGCVLWIGVLWTGGIGLVGALVFRNRELAHVQV